MVHLTDLITIQDLEETAAVVLPQAAHSYFMSGADEEQTIKENERAYDRFLFLPSMMVDPTNITMKTRIFGNTYSMPIAFAPCAMHKLAHPEGEKATVVSFIFFILEPAFSTASFSVHFRKLQ